MATRSEYYERYEPDTITEEFKQMRILLFLFSIFSFASGINPPQTGRFPDGFWEKMKNQNIGLEYGDPGWMRKISERKQNYSRNAQLNFNVPVLLGQYSDVSTTYFTSADFQNLLFDNNSDGSMKEYYNEISYGNFLVDGVTDGWYQSSLTMVEAVDNTKQYVAEIAELADPDYDFGQFDNDGSDNIPNSGDDDGYVDGIIVVYSGCGAEWGSGNDNIWPHMSSLGSYEYTTNDESANGGNIIISTYAVCPELAGGGDCYTNTIRPMGVYAHEFGHVLGLPDLYDRDDSDGDSGGIGEWGLMALGSWLGWGGDTPAHMSAWSKLQMGWLDATILERDQAELEIPQAETVPFTLKIWEDDHHWNRYFLVENRQAVGFDADINGTGLLIYHVDENQRFGPNRWSSGSVNDNELHKLVDIEEADGENGLDNEENRGDSGDPFPGLSGNISFDDKSNPNSNRYGGEMTGITVTNISTSDSVMTADITIRQQSGYAIVYDEMGISGWGFGYEEPQDSYGGVVFTPITSGYLTEVDVGIRAAPADFQVLVYDSFNGTNPGNLLSTISSSADVNQWYSFDIDSIEITAGADYFIAVMVNESYAVSYDNIGELSGRSYFSGNGVTYSDNISSYGDINIRSKISYGQLSVEDILHKPNEFVLFPAFPNPFNPVTTLRYNLPNQSPVKITIYDLLGKKVTTLISKTQDAGLKSVTWNATNDNGKPVSAGVYFYQIKAGDFVQTRKIVLLK